MCFFNPVNSNLIQTGAFIAWNDERRVYFFYKTDHFIWCNETNTLHGTTFSTVMSSKGDWWVSIEKFYFVNIINFFYLSFNVLKQKVSGADIDCTQHTTYKTRISKNWWKEAQIWEKFNWKMHILIREVMYSLQRILLQTQYFLNKHINKVLAHKMVKFQFKNVSLLSSF